MQDIRTIDISHYQLWGNSLQWIDKESLRLYGEMRLTPKVGDRLIDGVDEYKFTVVNECENKKVFFAEVEKM